MHPVRRHKPVSNEALALRELAIRRQSHWVGNLLAWAGGLVGCLSMFVLVAGIHRAAALPDTARPYGERATSAWAAMIIGGGFALLAFVLVGLALLHAPKRLRTLTFAVPAATTIALLLGVSHWAPW